MDRYSDEKIQEVREATDIVSFLSEYLPLKKSGRSYKTLCPFHSEKTPSFMVSPERQVYHCFGCGAGGNVFTYLMETEKISFPEAVRFLAKRSGIHLPVSKREGGEGGLDPLYRASDAVSSYYHNLLFQEEGRKAREYLKNRGITEETMKTFRIGVAPSGWDSLLEWARKNSISLKDLHAAGLIVEREGGGYYDRFRERILFPIQNLSGRVVGFGGRLYLGEGEPKYLNSPETPIYQKGKELYSLNQTRAEIRKSEKAIVVEGYMDLISLFQAGFRNTVATLGTALTLEQGKRLSRYTSKALLLYDPDKAGIEAALRGGELLLEQGLDIEVISLDEGMDPDLFIRNKGAKAFEEVLKKSKDYILFKLDLLQKGDESEKGEWRILKEMADTLGKIPDPLNRNLWADRIGKRFSLLPETLLQSFPKPKPQTQRPQPLKRKEIEEIEFRLIGLMIRSEKVIEEARASSILEDLSSPLAKELVRKILKDKKKIEGSSLLELDLDQEARRELSEILLLEDGSFNFNDEAKGCIVKIRRNRMEEKRKKIKAEMKIADGERLKSLEEEYKKISVAMAEIH